MEEYTYKLCLFGPGGVGKTTFTHKYLTGLFKEYMKLTMGAAIFFKTLEISGKRVNLQIWDFGGEEQFRFLLPVYSHRSSCGIFMYDISRYSTIKNMIEWISLFREGLDKNEKEIPLLMVGSKLDLVEMRALPLEDVFEIAKKNGCFSYIESSSKTGENVEKIFEMIILEVMKRFEIL